MADLKPFPVSRRETGASLHVQGPAERHRDNVHCSSERQTSDPAGRTVRDALAEEHSRLLALPEDPSDCDLVKPVASEAGVHGTGSTPVRTMTGGRWAQEALELLVTRAGSHPSRMGSAETFTGSVHVEPLLRAPSPARPWR